MGTDSKRCNNDTVSATNICKKLTNGCTNNGSSATHLCRRNNTCSSTSNVLVSQDSVPALPIFIDQEDVIGGAKEIIKTIRPDWNINLVDFKLFTDGITNKLVGCFNNESNLSEKDVTNNVVLVRIYGHKTDLLIDRKAETRNIKLLHTYGFAPTLFATFKNGLAYEYVPGVTLTPESVIKPEIWKLVACRLAEMHKVSSTHNNNSMDTIIPNLWKKTQQMLKLVPEQFSDPAKHSRLEKTFLPVEKLRNEFEYLYKRLEVLESPIVFAHNDLLLGNVIYTESQKSVTFIDYEYADYNFQAFDIGNHFAEFAGVDVVDYSCYPKKEFQMEWLKVYLQTYLEKDHVKPEEIERLYIQVNQFSLATHLFWIVWALIQAENSHLDFDFIEYAHIRYGEYMARKDEFLAMKLP